MAINKISDDELDQVNGGIDLTRSGGDKADIYDTQVYCPQCKQVVEAKRASGDQYICKKHHKISAADTNSKLMSGGSLSTETWC